MCLHLSFCCTAAIFLSSHSDIYIHKSRCIACWRGKQRGQWNERLQFLRTIFEINNYDRITYICFIVKRSEVNKFAFSLRCLFATLFYLMLISLVLKHLLTASLLLNLLCGYLGGLNKISWTVPQKPIS